MLTGFQNICSNRYSCWIHYRLTEFLHTLCVLLLCLSIFYISLASVVHIAMHLLYHLCFPISLSVSSSTFNSCFYMFHNAIYTFYFVTPFHHRSLNGHLYYVKNLNHYFHCMNVQYATKMIHFTLSVRYGVFAIGKRTCNSMLMGIPVMIAVSFHTKH